MLQNTDYTYYKYYIRMAAIKIVMFRFVLVSHVVECSMGSFIHRDSRS